MSDWSRADAPEAADQRISSDQRASGDQPVAGDRPEAAHAPEAAAPTGHPAVDTALRALREASHARPADQIPTYQAAHRTLRETLASIDES